MGNPNICECGRLIPDRFNSTIKSKYCPSCTYLNAVKPKKVKPTTDHTEKPKSKPKKKKAFDFYKTKMWWHFSRFVLLSYADENLGCFCSTNPKLYYKITDKRLHCGHYIKVRDGTKTNYAVALEFMNCAPQSYQENVPKGGNPEVMREFLIKKFGEEAIDELKIKSHNICKFDPVTVELLGDLWEQRLKDLIVEKGLKENPWRPKKRR